jgi:hypothetical protein
MNIEEDKPLQDLKSANSSKLDAWKRLTREIDLADQSSNTGFGPKITGIGLAQSDRPEVTIENRITVDFGGTEDIQRKILFFMEAYHEYLANTKGRFVFTDSNKGEFRLE